MKLLFVTQYVDLILSRLLERLAAEVELTVVYENDNEWNQQLAGRNVTLVRCAPRSRFDRVFRQRIAALAAETPFDLVQSFHGNDQLANLIRLQLRDTPLVAYRARIGHLKFRENPAAYWSVRNPNLAAVVAVSCEVRRYLESFRFLPARNVRVINHGIDTDWVDSEIAKPLDLRARLQIPDDAMIVASMAVLRPVKRFEYIAHAARVLQDRPVHFVHIGDPRGYERLTADLPQVHFVGNQQRPLPYLAAADVFAMTSHNEAFGRANLEAMACGKPVIGSNTGGLLDLVAPGVSGELFETSDPDDFVACIERYERHRGRLAEHGRNARTRVEERFSTGHMLDGYLSLYREVLAAHGSRTGG